jgi:hypothetical protein
VITASQRRSSGEIFVIIAIAGTRSMFGRKTSSASNLQNCGHCTKAKTGLKGHSRHPVPLLLVTKTGERDGMAFHERNYVTGSIEKTATNN